MSLRTKLLVVLVVALSAPALASPEACTGGLDADGTCAADSWLQTRAKVSHTEEPAAAKAAASLHQAGAHSNASQPPFGAGGNPGAIGNPARAECTALKAAAAEYRGQPGGDMYGAQMATDLAGMGYTEAGSWSYTPASGDYDHMGWWIGPTGDCILSFKGSEHLDDFMNNYNIAPTTIYGVSGVHSGIAAELAPLVSQVSWSDVRGRCPNGVTITGHSLGGGLAQALALALTNPADALNAQLTVNALYTFGPMPVATQKEGNAQASDGCFRGGVYTTSITAGDGTVQVDVVKSPSLGGNGALWLVKTKKTVLQGQGTPTVYPCGVALPASLTEIPITLPPGTPGAIPPYNINPTWLGNHMTYTYSAMMGCGVW